MRFQLVIELLNTRASWLSSKCSPVPREIVCFWREVRSVPASQPSDFDAVRLSPCQQKLCLVNGRLGLDNLWYVLSKNV